MKREPLVSAAVLTSILGAVVALLRTFGLDITNEQQAAVSGLALIVAPLLVALFVRPKVTPVAVPGEHERGAVDTSWALLIVLVLLAVCLFVWLFGGHINVHG